MIATATLNFIGGLPDAALARVAGMLRKSSNLPRAKYRSALAFYDRYLNQQPPLELFDLPRKAPPLSPAGDIPIPGGRRSTYRYPSRYRVKNPAVRRDIISGGLNARGCVHLWQHDGKERPPMVVCLHGFLLGNIGMAERMFRIRKLFGLGVDVALFVLPHHGERTNFFLNQKLLNPHDVPLTIESCAQTLHDLHAAILALRASGYERIGIIGASLGGWAGISYAGLSSLPEFLFAVVPALRLHDYLMPDGSLFNFAITEEIRVTTSMALDLITPQLWKPRLPVNNIAAVIHAGDKLNPAASANAWIKAWGMENVIRITGGHWWYFDKSARGKAWYGWLKEKGFIAGKNGEAGGSQ